MSKEIVVDSMRWVPVTAERKSIIVGGVPSITTVSNWPHFNDEALPYFGHIQHDGRILELFLGSIDNQSWLLEEGANCVSVDGEFPSWINLSAVEQPILYTNEGAWGTDDHLEEPEWLQGDETPEGFIFVAQIPSQIDGGDVINIGEGYGTAYVFYNKDRNEGRLLWQS